MVILPPDAIYILGTYMVCGKINNRNCFVHDKKEAHIYWDEKQWIINDTEQKMIFCCKSLFK